MKRIVSFVLGHRELDKLRSYLQDNYRDEYRFDESKQRIYDSAGVEVAHYSRLGLAHHDGAPEIIPINLRLEAILTEFDGCERRE